MKNTLLLMALVLITGPCSYAQQKNLWATATVGGAYGFGTILKGDSVGNNFTVVHSFDQTNGSYPIGKMAVTGAGIIYCVTELGGIDDSCTVCTYNTATDSFSMIHQFFANISTGGVPYSGVIVAYNGLIYGTTSVGGATYDSVTGVSGGGVIYSIDPSTNIYTDIYDFPDSNGYGPTSELLQAADGKLYGTVNTTYNDSVQGGGYLFSLDPSNNQFAQLYNLYPAYPSGEPSPSLVQGPDLKLYGVLDYVSLPDSVNQVPGILFSYDISNATFAVVYTFSANDGMPQGGLLAANGNIYGETINSVPGNSSEMYSYNIASATFTVLANFDSATGVDPIGGLGMLGNNQLTGSAMAGGLNNNGALFTFNLTYNTFSKMFDFDSATTGAYPMCNITETGFPTTGIITPANNSSISLSPNITADYTYVHTSGVANNAALRFALYDITGKLLLTNTLTGNLTTIDCNNLPSAVYIWRVLDENENVMGVGKLIKQ